jgi:trans-aconitate 2-methyltransferase
MQYLFGDTDLAARRLKILADVYAEPTRTFVLDTVIDKPRLAIDLGCGPGYTTHLLADILDCDQIVGLDNSEHFISLAQKTETERVRFRRHDVTTVPFPTPPADFLYCRFLLTHLQDPLTVVAKWTTHLRPRGLLLMEETEWIETSNATLQTYLDIVAAMLEHQNGKLYVGPLLDGMHDTDAFERRISQVRRFSVSTPRAAMMFSHNIRTWKHQAFVRENYSPSVISKLEQDLTALASSPTNEMEIEWGLRQLVFERI